MDDFNGLMEELESIKLRQKVLNEEEALCREEIQKLMQIFKLSLQI